MKIGKYQVIRDKNERKNIKNLFKINLRKKLLNIIENFTGHNIERIKSFNDFVKYMYEPVDAASLGIGRIFFGILMLIDIPEERSGSEIPTRWNLKQKCFFPLIPAIQAMNVEQMAIVYGIMWLGALGITLGYKFRITSAMFAISYWYIFVIDISVWNNHSYLYGLCGILFMFSSAHNFFSIDSLLKPKSINNIATVPFWNYFILKFQFFIMYTVAGLKKFSSEWLSGYAMLNLSYHWVFAPFRYILGSNLTDLLIIHWFTCIFDLTIAFWLTYQPTRYVATLFCTLFHLMNSRLFSIGMFPWVCLAELPLFYPKYWPRILMENMKKMLNLKDLKCSYHPNQHGKTKRNLDKPIYQHNKRISKIKLKQKLIICTILLYCSVQIILPYSHFITLGFNNWTDGVYGYSWDMMIHAWDTVLVSIKVIDHNNPSEILYLKPEIFTKNDRWTKHAYLAKEYANCINRKLQKNKQSLLLSSNISIYLDVWCSLNGRFQQRMFDPNIDILKADWYLFTETTWMKPLLRKFTSKRSEMLSITQNVLQWNNFSDVMFVADFPNHLVDSFISPDLVNVTLTVLEGVIDYEEEDGLGMKGISSGQSIKIESDSFHKVKTTGGLPSCFMYTYKNRTMENFSKTEKTESHDNTLVLSFWTEIAHRHENLIKFYKIMEEFVFLKYYNKIVSLIWT